MSRHFYVGPYIIAKNSWVDSSKNVRTCTKLDCEMRHKSFPAKKVQACRVCGSPLEKRVQPIKIAKVWNPAVQGSWLDFQLAFSRKLEGAEPYFSDDVFFSSDHEFLRKVSRPLFSYTFKLNSDHSIFVSSIHHETELFESTFGENIAKLKEAYGDGNVSITWGGIYYKWVPTFLRPMPKPILSDH